MPSDILLTIKSCSKGTKMYKTRWKTIENTLQNNLIVVDTVSVSVCLYIERKLDNQHVDCVTL